MTEPDLSAPLVNPSSVGTNYEPKFRTQEEADAWISAYNRDRCTCGGSPAWVDPIRQMHRVDCRLPRKPYEGWPEHRYIYSSEDGDSCSCGWSPTHFRMTDAEWDQHLP